MPIISPAIKIEQEKGAFIFYVESTGALKAERIVLEAAKILDLKARSFVSQLSSIKTGGKAENEVESG